MCNRNSMCTRRHCRRSSTRSLPRRLTTSSFGVRRRRLTVLSVRDCCGVLQDKVSDVLSVESRRMRNAKICSMPTAFNVRTADVFTRSVIEWRLRARTYTTTCCHCVYTYVVHVRRKCTTYMCDPLPVPLART